MISKSQNIFYGFSSGELVFSRLVYVNMTLRLLAITITYKISFIDKDYNVLHTNLKQLILQKWSEWAKQTRNIV